MDNKITIRLAEVDDCDLIIDFIRKLADYERLTGDVSVNKKLVLENLFGENKKAECLIAEYKGTAAGFAVFFHNFSTFKGKAGLYLEDLFVLEELRGNGIGKLLLIELAKIANKRNCARFEWSVLDWNKPAIDFYESLGAKPMSDWTVFRLNEDGIENLSRM